MWFDPDITNYFRELLPWAGGMFSSITELGSSLFYILLILSAYWGYRKKESIIAIFVVLFAAISNYWLKVAIANPRPDPSYWYEGASEPNYSTPSAHAQASSTLYGWVSAKVKTWWALVISIALVTLIGLSRVYLGLHYIEDVLLGWGIGIASAIFLYYAIGPVSEFLSRFKSDYLYLTLFIFGFLVALILSILVPDAAGDNYGSIGGLTMGLAIGVPLERRYVNFEVEPADGKQWKKVVRVVLGLVIIVGLVLGLSPILPTSDVWLRTIRYTIVGIVGIFVWPLIFKKLNL